MSTNEVNFGSKEKLPCSVKETLQNQNHFKTDDCYKTVQSQDNKSIFGYITDTNMFVNKNQCFDSTPPWLGFLNSGIPAQNIDIETDLWGINRLNSRCPTCKFESNNPTLTQQLSNTPIDVWPNNKHECKADEKILPFGYNSF